MSKPMICTNKMFHLGRYDTEEEAIDAEVRFELRRQTTPDPRDKASWSNAAKRTIHNISNNPNYTHARGRVL